MHLISENHLHMKTDKSGQACITCGGKNLAWWHTLRNVDPSLSIFKRAASKPSLCRIRGTVQMLLLIKTFATKQGSRVTCLAQNSFAAFGKVTKLISGPHLLKPNNFPYKLFLLFKIRKLTLMNKGKQH